MTIHTVQEETTWRAQASCVGGKLVASAWFPGKDFNASNYRAISICESCPVSTECFEEGAELEEWYTIRGGIPGPERHDMARSLL
jgi:hypothetical protein